MTIKEISPYLGLNLNGINLVSFLATEGLVDAVNEMLRNGANKADAIYGYALKGNVEKVRELISTGAEEDCIRFAIRGYARGGHVTHIRTIPNYRSHTSEVIFGLAQAGDHTQVTAKLGQSDNRYYAEAIKGYASANQLTSLKKLVKGTGLFPVAIFEAARSGHQKLVTDLLVDCGVSRTFSLIKDDKSDLSPENIGRYGWLNTAASGYMAGRHFDEAIELLKRGASITLCLSELKEPSGKPSHDLYMTFLAHIDAEALRTAVLEVIAKQSQADPSLMITPADLDRILLINTQMTDHHLNYLDACRKVDEIPYETTDSKITLPTLSGLIDTDGLSAGSSRMSF